MSRDAHALEAARDDSTLIFLHIPKTGGVTLTSVMLRNFRPGETYEATVPIKGDHPYHDYLRTGRPLPQPSPRDQNARWLERLRLMSAEDAARLRLFYGHFWFGVHEALPGPSTYVTLLRDPIERVLSLYGHRQRAVGLEQSIEDYVAVARDFMMVNGQTRRFGRTPEGDHLPRGEVTAQTLASAKEALGKHFGVVGITERFDESLICMQHRFGWKKLHYYRKNVGRNRVPRSELPARLIDRIAELNAYDMELYEYGCALLDEAVAEIEPIADQLASLRRKNRIYAKVGPPLTAVNRTVRRHTVSRLPPRAKARLKTVLGRG